MSNTFECGICCNEYYELMNSFAHILNICNLAICVGCRFKICKNCLIYGCNINVFTKNDAMDINSTYIKYYCCSTICTYYMYWPADYSSIINNEYYIHYAYNSVNRIGYNLLKYTQHREFFRIQTYPQIKKILNELFEFKDVLQIMLEYFEE